MRMTVVAPSPSLAPHVRRFTLVEADRESTRVLLPEPGVLLAFRYAGSSRLVEPDGVVPLPDFVVTGPRATARVMQTAAGGGVVVAALRETGAAAFLAEPLHELFGASLGLDAFVRASELERLGRALAEPAAPRARVALVERFLLARRRPVAGDRLVAAAVAALQASGGTRRVAELARELDIGVDRLEKRFRQAVGTSPKQLGSLYRLLRAIELHRSGASLTASALEAGYADQSHFIRSFRAALGEAPRRFLGSAAYCGPSGSGSAPGDEWLDLRASQPAGLAVAP